jgi:hypothetical protein
MSQTQLQHQKAFFTIGELVREARHAVLTQGTEHGVCAMCRRQIENGVKLDFGDCFTLSEYLCGYPIACPECWQLYTDSWFRTNCWLATPTILKKLERKIVLIALLTTTELPFAVYTTDNYKKQGYLQMMSKSVNIDPNYLAWGWDITFFACSRAKLISYLAMYRLMQKAGLRRTEIETGYVPQKTFLKIPEADRRAVLDWIRTHTGDQLWQFTIAFFPRDDIEEVNQIDAILTGVQGVTT